MAAVDDFDEVIEPCHLALGEIIKGNPEGYKKLYSHGDDVTLANPFGPPALGWDEVARTLERAASHYTDGELTDFENVSRYVSAELAYLVEIERFEAKVGPREDPAPVALRVVGKPHRYGTPCSPRRVRRVRLKQKESLRRSGASPHLE